MVSPRSMPVGDNESDPEPVTLDNPDLDIDTNDDYDDQYTQNRLTKFSIAESAKVARRKSRQFSASTPLIGSEATTREWDSKPYFWHVSPRKDSYNDEEAPVSVQSPETRNSHTWLGLLKKILNKASNSADIDPAARAEELADEFERYFPCRAKLPVQVVDFKQSNATRMWVNLGDIQKYMFEKPDDVQVRWIHAPLGIGLYHSSIEDIFLLGVDKEGVKLKGAKILPKGAPFRKAGRAGWPYLETEIINIQSFADMESRRKLALQFLENKDAQAILDKRVFEGDENQTLKTDVKLRAEYLGKDLTFWEAVKSDLSWLLTDGALNMKSPAAVSRDTNFQVRPQMLQQNQVYETAYIARDSFRCFHRQDGFVLSLSPSKGVDYLTAQLPTDLARAETVQNESEEKQKMWLEDDDLFVVAQAFSHFKEQGVKFWSKKTAEWLVVFLITEVASTPNAIRSGYSAPSILDAYDAIVHGLIDKKFERRQKQSTSLVQEYLKTIDELRALDQIYKTKLNLLRRLRRDCLTMESDQPRRKSSASTLVAMNLCTTMVGRVEFAITAVTDLHSQCEQLIKELSNSLTSLFRLLSIEQNDRSISADSQSKAIFIITLVTIVFLPLSFMTSYFAMNVPDIAPKSQQRFWVISAPLTTGIIFAIFSLVSILNLYQNRIRAGYELPTAVIKLLSWTQ